MNMVRYFVGTEIFVMFLFSVDPVCPNESTTTELPLPLPYYVNEEKLRSVIFANHSRLLRPAKRVSVWVMLSLLRVNGLNVESQRLELTCWMKFKWHDPRLVWDPREFGGVRSIYDSELTIWRPEILVRNSVRRLRVLGDKKIYLRVSSTGDVSWDPPGIFHTHCDVDVTFFPFDWQTCPLKLIAWSLTMNEMVLYRIGDQINLNETQQNGEWEVMGSWMKRQILANGEINHSELFFYLQLKRRPNHYVLKILIPVVVFAVMASLVFLVPSASGAMIPYSLTILLTYTVMLSIVSGNLPSSSRTTAVLSVYLTIVLINGVIITFLAVLITHMHYRPPEPGVPWWLQRVVNSVLLPMAGGKSNEEDEELGDEEVRFNYEVPTSMPAIMINNNNSNNNNNNSKNNNNINKNNNNRTSISEEQSNNIEPEMSSVDVDLGSRSVRVFTPVSQAESGIRGDVLSSSMVKKTGQEQPLVTWQDVSSALSHVCLRFIGPFVILLTVTVLLVMIFGGQIRGSQRPE